MTEPTFYRCPNCDAHERLSQPLDRGYHLLCGKCTSNSYMVKIPIRLVAVGVVGADD